MAYLSAIYFQTLTSAFDAIENQPRPKSLELPVIPDIYDISDAPNNAVEVEAVSAAASQYSTWD